MTDNSGHLSWGGIVSMHVASIDLVLSSMSIICRSTEAENRVLNLLISS